MKKIVIISFLAFIFASQNAYAGGSMAPYVRATTASRQLGISSAPVALTVSFCNNDHNSPSQKVKLKIQTKAIKTNGRKPKGGNKTHIVSTTTDANSCGNATISINGLYNVKLKIKEKEGGSNGWWTAWSKYWTTR